MFLNKNKQNKVDTLLHIKEGDELFNKLTVLQNEINVYFDTNIIAFVSIDSDSLTAVLAKAFADTYALNKSSALIIDANLYNPCLEGLFTKQDDSVAIVGKQEKLDGQYQVNILNDKVGYISIEKQIYPGNILKDKVVHKMINEWQKIYEHIIILVPSIKEHKEILLLSDIINTSLLIVKRNVTKKEDIFNAVEFFRVNELPLAQTIVVK